MTKWADFVVSAIKKGSGLSNISHVQIHEDLEHGFGHPELIDKYQLSSKIQNGISFVTVHKKNENEWTIGKTIRTYVKNGEAYICLLYTSPSPRDRQKSRMPSSA